MHDLSRDDVPKHTALPQFLVVNFDRTPIKCCQYLIMQRFMYSRMGSENSKNREELMQMAEKLCLLNKITLPPQKMSMQIDAWNLCGAFSPVQGKHWIHDDCCRLLKTSACIVDDYLIDDVFLLRNENNRKRDI